MVEQMQRWDTQVRDEHEALRGQVGALEAAMKADVSPQDRKVSLAWITIRALGPSLEFHLRKEEEVLFPALQRLLGKKGKAIEFLKQQHQELRLALRSLAGLVCDCGCEPEACNWKEVASASQRFRELFEEHEKREDQLLKEALELSLKPQELKNLVQALNQATWTAYREEL